MSAKKFRFISPGIFMNEIDRSQLNKNPAPVGPVVIGRTERGPGLRPVTVNSFLEFIEIFGNPVPGGNTEDVWRNGNRTTPMYASYAARAWLKNGSPLTVVRVLGASEDDPAPAGEAGWKTTNSPAATAGANGGAFGLYITNNEPAGLGIIAASGSITMAGTGVDGETLTLVGTATHVITQSSTTDLDNFSGSAVPGTAATNLAAAITAGSATHGITAVAVGAAVNMTATATGVAGNSYTATSTITDSTPLSQTFAGGTIGPGTSLEGTLAAIFYLDKGTIRLTGLEQSGSSGEATVPSTEGTCQLVQSNDGDFGFKAIIADGAASSNLTQSFNFNSNSDLYIRKVFNTNPTLLGETNKNATEYFLGESFERSLYDTVYAANTGSADSGGAVGFIVALKGCDSRNQDAQAATTGFVISQDTGPTSSYDPAAMPELFKFTALDTGDWINSNVKISIADISAPTNPEYDEYGTFTVEVRDAQDTDANPQILEAFTGCNLNPDSPSYVCTKIGDKFATWSKTENRFTEQGNYNNKSKYIYVTPSDALDEGDLDASLIPFGFKGPPTYLTVSGTLGSAAASPWITDLPHTASGTGIIGSGSAINDYTCSGPVMPLRHSSSFGGFSDVSSVYWGATTDKSSAPRYDASYADLTCMLPDLDTVGLPSPAKKEVSFAFSLDDISYVSSSDAGKVETNAYYEAGLRASGDSLTAGGLLPGTGSEHADVSFKSVLDQGMNRFTMPLVGGFDGFDIKERDPLSNSITDTKDVSTSYAFNSIRRAIDTVADPEIIEMNAITIPGITNSSLTNHLVTVCEERADSLAILDLEGGYVPAYENDTGEAIIGSVTQTVNDLQDRSMNSSYACAYYPWVQTKDEFGSGKILWVPPSVAALGTFASNDKKSAPWFAPAGFTRGGLSDGAAGIPVIGVREHLTRKMRDKLYENNINPIAKFPAEGIVIFGQKTMQATPSALDRVNVRRMMIHVKKGISNIASTLLFDQNVKTTWNRFLGKADPFLRDVQAQLGLTNYKIVLDESTTTPDLVDRNILYAKIFLQPARSIEFIAIDFVIQRSGASFDD